MPSPIGHSLVGLTVHLATSRQDQSFCWRRMALCVFAANAPDLDFIPGLLAGEPDRFHHGASHSLGFALVFAILISLFLRGMKIDWVRSPFLILLGLYSSHLALDYLSIDTAPPYGLPLLWPATHKYYIAAFPFLPDIRRDNSTAYFLPSLVSGHNLWSVALESFLLAPLLLLVRALRSRPNAGEGRGGRNRCAAE